MTPENTPMTGRDRYLTALRGGVPDRVPLHELHWSPRFIRETLGQLTSPHHNADDEVAMARATGVDMVWTAPLGFTALTNVQLHGEEFVDEWGTPWGSNEQSWPAAWSKDDVVKSRSDWLKVDFPDPDLPGQDGTAQALHRAGAGRAGGGRRRARALLRSLDVGRPGQHEHLALR